MGGLWLSLERYKDFIVNGLDLLAFLLVTPEVLRLILPAVTSLIAYILAVVVTTISLIIVLIILVLFFSFLPRISIPDWFASALAGVLILLHVCVGIWIEGRLRPLSQRLAQRTAVAGIFFFIISRGFAFVMATHDLLTKRS